MNGPGFAGSSAMSCGMLHAAEGPWHPAPASAPAVPATRRWVAARRFGDSALVARYTPAEETSGVGLQAHAVTE